MASKQKVSYRVEVTSRFDKDFIKLPKSVRVRISTKIDELETNPYSNKALHGDMTGLFSLRSGDYRIIYSVDEAMKRVLLLSAKHRKHSYNQL